MLSYRTTPLENGYSPGQLYTHEPKPSHKSTSLKGTEKTQGAVTELEYCHRYRQVTLYGFLTEAPQG